MVQVLTLLVLLTTLGAGAAHGDCLVLCPPPSEPAPGNPPPEAPTPPPNPAPVPPPPAPTPPPGETVSPEGARRLLELINRSRADRGLPPMSHRADVASIAVDHSRAMAKAGDIWHNDSYFSADTKRRLGARTVGENVAMNNSIDDAHARLMASPGHRANILNPAFVVAGIGVVQRNGGSYYITEDFVEPLSAATPKPATPAAERPRGAPAPKAAAAAAAPTTTEAVAPPTTERREHFPNGIASTTSQPRRLNAGAGPSDTRSAVLFVAVALLTLVGATAGRRMLRRRAGA